VIFVIKIIYFSAALPESATDESGGGVVGNGLGASSGGAGGVEDDGGPMVRKKTHDFLGMFEYKKEQEQQILKAMVYGRFSFKWDFATILNKKGLNYVLFFNRFTCATLTSLVSVFRFETQDGSADAARIASLRSLHDD